MRVGRQQFLAQNSNTRRRGDDKSHLFLPDPADSDHQLLAAKLADQFFVGALRVGEEMDGFKDIAAQQQVAHGDSLARWLVGAG